MKTTVSIVEASAYEPKAVRAAVDEAIALAGGLDERIRRSDKVFLKINHLGHYAADSAVVTHPEVAAAVACHLRDLGAKVVIGDGLECGDLDFYEKSGYAEAAKRYDLELVNLRGGRYLNVQAKSGLELALAAEAVEADHLVNVPKLKTHLLTLLTCAIKNHYGLLPLYLRRNFHRDFVVPSDFAAAVVDIYEQSKPLFHVVDGVMALEGMGPSSGGNPRFVGVVLAGADGVAVDAVAAALLGLDPLDVTVTAKAASRGLGIADLAQIDMEGSTLTRAAAEGFALPHTLLHVTNFVNRLPGPLADALGALVGLTREIPAIVPRRCIGCGLCKRHCPREAIEIVRRKAVIDYSKCISCFCCQEFCQSDAIEVSHTPLGDLLLKSVACVKNIVKRKPKAGAER